MPYVGNRVRRQDFIVHPVPFIGPIGFRSQVVPYVGDRVRSSALRKGQDTIWDTTMVSET